jgi:hypothetical protein
MLRYVLFPLAPAAAFAAAALSYYGAAPVDQLAWVAGVALWAAAAGAGLAVVTRPAGRACRPVASRRPV